MNIYSKPSLSWTCSAHRWVKSCHRMPFYSKKVYTVPQDWLGLQPPSQDGRHRACGHNSKAKVLFVLSAHGLCIVLKWNNSKLDHCESLPAYTHSHIWLSFTLLFNGTLSLSCEFCISVSAFFFFVLHRSGWDKSTSVLPSFPLNLVLPFHLLHWGLCFWGTVSWKRG